MRKELRKQGEATKKTKKKKKKKRRRKKTEGFIWHAAGRRSIMGESEIAR